MDFLDGYYIPDSTFEVESAAGTVESEEGDGFGIKLAMMLGESIFLAGEYQSTDNEGLGAAGDATVETSRVGLGYNTALPLYALIEYARAEIQFSGADDVSDSGFAAHLGVKFDVMEYLTLEARGGYLDIGDFDGFEYLAGVALNLDASFGLFADYRVTDVEGEDDLQLTAQDVRAGMRFRF